MNKTLAAFLSLINLNREALSEKNPIIELRNIFQKIPSFSATKSIIGALSFTLLKGHKLAGL